MAGVVSVAIPVRDGAAVLTQTLAAVRSQRLDGALTLELVVCDSGSRDDSRRIARRFGAKLIEIPAQRFSHGGTRNLLMERSHGDWVAFLTQDSVPADERWLQRLLDAFSVTERVGLAFGPYRPRPGASPMVARELTDWFASFAPGGGARIDRLSAAERDVPARALLGRRAFFTDANGAVARWAWRVAPFRDVPYAEDHVLALDMLRAGFAKVYVPAAAVIHSHDYSASEWFKRSFDEARALRAVYGFAEPADPRSIALKLRGLVGADWRWARWGGGGPASGLLVRSTQHHAVRIAGAVLGARADRLGARVAARLSLERRAR